MSSQEIVTGPTSTQNAIRWVNSNPGLYELLGVIPDVEIAEKFGCKLNRVQRYRRALGIKFKRGRKTENGRALSEPRRPLSEVEISSLASNICKNRQENLTEKYERKYPGIFNILGIETDQYVGDRYGVTRETIRLIRNKFSLLSSQDRTAIKASKHEQTITINKSLANSIIEISNFFAANRQIITEIANQIEGEE